MEQDCRKQDNWCIPAVQGTGQEICDTSDNRLQSHLHFLHSECSAGPYLQCAFVILSSQRWVMLKTHMWNQEWNSWAVRQWPFIKSSHKTGRTCQCIVRHWWFYLCPGESEMQLCYCNKYLPETFPQFNPIFSFSVTVQCQSLLLRSFSPPFCYSFVLTINTEATSQVLYIC